MTERRHRGRRHLEIEATGDTVPSDDPQHVVIAPGGTAAVGRVLPTSSDEKPGAVPTDDGSPFSQAFSLGGQI